jgi:hypothetical protein
MVTFFTMWHTGRMWKFRRKRHLWLLQWMLGDPTITQWVAFWSESRAHCWDNWHGILLRQLTWHVVERTLLITQHKECPSVTVRLQKPQKTAKIRIAIVMLWGKAKAWWRQVKADCRNLSLELVTKARVCKSAGQEGSPKGTSYTLGNAG